MAMKLAQGVWLKTYSAELINWPAGPATDMLSQLPSDSAASLLQDFSNCKVAMVQRFQQVYGYWRQLPWRLCALGMPLFDSNARTVKASKAFCVDVMQQWNECSMRDRHMFKMAQRFFDPHVAGSLHAHMLFWAQSKTDTMPELLALELMKYCSALTTMQRLEAQHHYLNQQIAGGRRSLPASVCAYLRRRANGDLETASFRKHLDKYVLQLHKLVAVSWETRSALQLHNYRVVLRIRN